MLEAERGLACFQIDDEAQTHTSSQRQLCLSEAKLFSSRAYGMTKILRRGNTNHEGVFYNQIPDR